MKISEEFPSKYLKSSDLKGQEVRVLMANVEREEIGQEKKLVLYFKGKEKGIVLNKTNANTIGDFYGDDSDDWYDQPLILFSIRTEFQGKPVDGLRVRIPTARDNKRDPISSGTSLKAQLAAQADPQPPEISDDEIPF